MKLKKNCYSSLSIILARTVLIIIPALLFYAGRQPGVFIQNPYEDVDWSKYKPYKANLNTHTMVTDGWENPPSVVENYRKLDYHILAITDPDTVTYPWEGFSHFKASELSFSRVYHLVVKPFEENSIFLEETEFKDVSPSEVGMVAIQGSKLSFGGHEVNSYFNDYCRSDDNIFKSVAAKKGLIIMNHPGQHKFHAEQYADLFKSYNHLVGVEVFNSVKRDTDIRLLWDSVQTLMAPVRPVWGFANDNFLSLRDLGENWNTFILPELNKREVRRAMEKGNFYFVHAPKGHNGPLPPVIKSIQVNHKKGVINIEASGQDSIIWVTGGKKICRGAQLTVKRLPANSKYIRAELYGAGNSIVCTQPFMIQYK
jgi:hypothetical protein